MKKMLSALISMTISFGAVPVISNAEYTEYTLPYELSEAIPPSVQPYTVDGDTVIFEGGKDYDFIVSSLSKFTSERKDNSFTFKPSYNSTSFLISRVYIAEEIINCDVVYDIEENMPVIESHCHYFYPVIENFEVSYNINTGTQIEYIGRRSYRNETNIDKIKSGEMGVCFDYFEDYDTEKICNSGDYYALASRIADSNMFFTFFDYGYEYTKKDKSVFCLKTPYSTDDTASSYIDVSGNAEIKDTFYSGSYIDGNLMTGTGDVVSYTTIEPTSDGFVEIYSPDIIPMFSIILNVANGKFIPVYTTIGCVLPEKCDLNMDGYINISDAVIFQKYLLGKTDLTRTQYSCADMNDDGFVDIFDMVLLRQKVIEENYLGLIPEPIDTIQYSGEECGKNPEIS
ncbi:MAG: dockerin type I repeat-containing protein [Ruminococcus sp.]|nr:dockerin type I repeat-containing protein [Ruminococcus sp.]